MVSRLLQAVRLLFIRYCLVRIVQMKLTVWELHRSLSKFQLDLLKEIPPQLDEVQKWHAHGGGPINAVTLDRALAGACTS
jgi:hypothetical protein